MKKSKFMRVAAILMAAVLLTTCAISGTFAKYTSKANGSATARVAKWGFDAVDLIINDLFNDVYATDDTTTYDGTNSVDSNDDAKVIAPGTYGSADFAFAPEALPEVAYTLTVTATGTCAQSIQDNTNIRWGLDVTNVGTDEALTWTELLAAINALAGDVYGPNTAPTGFGVGDTHTISWHWAFETTTGTGQPATQDGVDTTMGNADTLASTTLNISVIATQVD